MGAQSQGHGVASPNGTGAKGGRAGWSREEESGAALLLGTGVLGLLTKHKTLLLLSHVLLLLYWPQTIGMVCNGWETAGP